MCTACRTRTLIACILSAAQTTNLSTSCNPDLSRSARRKGKSVVVAAVGAQTVQRVDVAKFRAILEARGGLAEQIVQEQVAGEEKARLGCEIRRCVAPPICPWRSLRTSHQTHIRGPVADAEVLEPWSGSRRTSTLIRMSASRIQHASSPALKVPPTQAPYGHNSFLTLQSISFQHDGVAVCDLTLPRTRQRHQEPKQTL